MRLSRLFVPTLREDPADAEIASHRLLLRAGFIRQVTAGIYTTLPMGLRSMRRIEAIVREEMDAAGGIEIRMPIAIPAEPWRMTGRWELYGDQLFRLRDRHGRDMLLGPTQEEVVTPLVAAEVPSYRDLPLNLYQVEWKYRDEFRPRFGLLRGREFLMKDAYSFDRDEAGMLASYDLMRRTYHRIFDRCRLDYAVVVAEAGQIGGGLNHEFMARAGVGEDLFVECEHGDYVADLKAARPMPPEPAGDPQQELAEIDTPDTPTIESLAALLGIDASATLKCVMFDVGGRSVAVLVPGDREVNEAKLEQLTFPETVRRFDDDDFATRGFVKGYVGPQGFGEGVTVYADHSVRGGRDWVTGSNRADHHVSGANAGRDFRVDAYEDLVVLREGDRCPVDGGALHIGRAIVVGHIYQLGQKYAKPLEATFTDEDGSERVFWMGCYGIGISRILAAAAEQCHDDDGLTLPPALAPFDVAVILATRNDAEAAAAADRIHGELEDGGAEVVLDDRAERAGVKFADADLIGYPVQITVGTRGIANGTVDLKVRATGERSSAPVDGAAAAASALLAALR